jgi:cardiolipin synthase
MADMYERDLAHTTEVVLKKRRRVRLPSQDDDRGRSQPARGSLVRATAGALRFTRTVSAAMSGQRVLETGDVLTLLIAAAAALAFAAVAVFLPRIVAWTAAVIAILVGALLLWRALRTRTRRERRGNTAPPA